VFVELMSNMATDSTSVARAQIDLFNDSMAVWQSVAERAIPGAH
jgi:polyhydroxyalkanoate synthase